MIHYQFKPTPEAEAIIEELRLKLAKVAGVTVVDNFVTVRWNNPKNDRLKHVQLAVIEVEDGGDRTECDSCGCVTQFDSHAGSLCPDCYHSR
jgi:hypothetical protein